MPKRTRSITGYLLVLAATAIWSGNFIVARGLADSVPPVTLAFLRWSTAVIVFLPFTARALWRDIQIVRRHLGYITLTAFILVTVFNTLIYIAAHTSNALNLSLIAMSSPIFIVVFARIFLNDPFTPRRITGLVTATFGVVLLITQGDFSRLLGLTFSRGDIWMLVAAAIFGVYSVLVGMKPAELSPLVFLSSMFILGLLFMVPWLIWEQAGAPTITLSPAILGAVIYLGVGPSLLAFLCWNEALAIIGPVRAAFVYYSLPLFSGIEALILLHEPVHWVHVISGALILAGVVVSTQE